MSSESSGFEQFYSHFIYRDFCYLFSGGLFFCTIVLALKGEISNPIEFLPKEFSLEIIGFLAGSYFLGLAMERLSQLFNSLFTHLLNRKDNLFSKSYIPPPPYTDYLLYFQDILETYENKVINEHERTFFMSLIGRTVGFSSFLGAILMNISVFVRLVLNNEIPTFKYVILSIILLCYGVLMIYDSTELDKIYLNQKSSLIEDIKKKNQNALRIKLENMK